MLPEECVSCCRAGETLEKLCFVCFVLVLCFNQESWKAESDALDGNGVSNTMLDCGLGAGHVLEADCRELFAFLHCCAYLWGPQ